MGHKVTRHERGTFDDACKRAVVFTNRHSGDLDMVENFLERAGWLHATFGVEAVQVGDRELRYLNVGDTYHLTIGQEGDGPVFNTAWGDWVEQAEQEYNEREDLVNCVYCGNRTPTADPWDATICESCGRNVSTGEAIRCEGVNKCEWCDASTPRRYRLCESCGRPRGQLLDSRVG